MTPVEATLLVGGGGLLLTQLGLLVRFSNSIAVNAKRLDGLEQTKAERSELAAVKAETHDLKSELATVKQDVKDLGVNVQQVRVDLARIPEQMAASERVQQMRHDALNQRFDNATDKLSHSLNNLKQMVEGVGARVLRGGRPDA